MNQPIALKWVGMFALGAFLQYGHAFKDERGRMTQSMQVEEPSGKTEGEGHLSPYGAMEQTAALPSGQRQAQSALTPEEQSRVLLLRMEAQKALREFKAKKMANHRRQGKVAWKRELEGFLSAQRKIERKQVNLERLPHSKSKKAKKAPDSEWHPIRKGRGVLT